MPFNGSGTFQRVRNWVSDAAAAIKIRADYHDSEDDGFAAGLSNCICKDGQTVIAQNIPWNAKRIVNLGDPVNPQDAMTKGYAESAAGGFVKKIGDTMSGNLVIAKNAPVLFLNKTTAGEETQLVGQKASLNRWSVNLGNSSAESGSNAGSDFGVARFDDAGNYASSPLMINRGSGNVWLQHHLYFQSGDGTSYIRLTDANVERWAIGKDNTGGNFAIHRYNDSGGYLDAPFTINRATGIISTGHLQVYGALKVAPGDGSIFAHTNGQYIGIWGGVSPLLGNTGGLLLNGGGRSYVHELYWGGTRIQMSGGDGSLWIIGNGMKPGGGSWGDSSDARIKNVLGDYDSGLDDILALQPVRYTFKGNDTVEAPANATLASDPRSKETPAVPYPNSLHYQPAKDAKEFVGFVAQDAEASNPDIVTRREGYIDGVRVTDLRDLDQSRLIFKLINAVKTLNARVAALEGAA